MKITITAIIERQRARFYIRKKFKKIAERFYIQRAIHFSKSKTITVAFLYPKSNSLYVAGFFMKFLKLAFIFKKNYALGYVTLLYTKSKTLRKNYIRQFAIRFIYKNPALCVPRFFNEFLKFAEGGDIYSLKIQGTCVNLFYTKCLSLCLTFNNQKTMHFSLRLYKYDLSCTTDT